MNWQRLKWKYWMDLFRRPQLERELDEEIRSHVEIETARRIRLGESPDQARLNSLREIRSVSFVKEEARDARTWVSMERLAQDLRYALRTLRRQPAFTAVAVLTLALGIGANTAIFSVVNGVLLKPLPFDHPERIVTVWEDYTAQGGPTQEWIEIPNFVEWRKEADLFETLSAFAYGSTILSNHGEVERLSQGVITHEFFATFGVTPAIGRDFEPADDQPGGALVTMLSHGFWQRGFGSDPSVLGTTLFLGGNPTTVIGVMPESFQIPSTPTVDVWTPLQLDESTASRGNFFLQGMGRLQEGVSVEQAETRLNVIMEQIGNEFPINRGVKIGLVPLLDQIVSPVRTALYVLLGVVVFVLLIACANIANLMLSRSSTRNREMAIRSAIGAGRGRLVRQLLTESVVLSLFGAGCGVLLAYWGTKAFVAQIPAGALPRLSSVAIDPTVLLFTTLISVAAGLSCGLAPALQSYRYDVSQALNEGGRGVEESTGGTRMRAVLAVGQAALALCLLIAAGLTIRSFTTLLDVDPGFEPEGLTTAFVSMPANRYAGAPELVVFLNSLLDRIGERPGFDQVAAVSVLPLGGSDSDTGFEIEGRPELNVPGQSPTVWFRRVTPSYFRTMGLPVVGGREFAATDHAEAPRVVMVNDVAAEHWPGDDAVGKRLRFGPESPWHTIVGIAQGVRHKGLAVAPTSELYFPFDQRPGRAMTIVVKSDLDDSAVTGLLRGDLGEIDPELPLAGVVSMDSLMEFSVAQPRFFMNMTAAFGLLALALATVGIYGVLSYTVSRKTKEMGLRMALGADRMEVLSMVVKQGLRLTVVGIGAGLTLAYAATRLMASILFGIDPQDLIAFTGAPFVLTLTALVACIVPALKATRIDPVKALRVD